MASNGVHDNMDEDDEFDWEAAVREIDVACQATKPSTSVPIQSSHQVSAKVLVEASATSSETHKQPGSSRQSTLDKFISRAAAEPRLHNRDVKDREQVRIEGDENVGRIKIDAEAAKTWIYPVNVPLRDYQLSISRTALFSNTLVALPTGLGKTLIAAVVMYNYFRWFPEGKIVFAAPSRPLVMQQIEACHNVVGIPQEWTIDLTGQTSPAKRACFWKDKRVFFVTPQVLERDIQSGTCLVKDFVCLVIDEAHRALGNYSYCVAMRELMAVPVQLRILALTATPGSQQQTIQLIIDNLQISTLEYRNEDDHDVSPYVHDKKIELLQVPMGQDAVEINNLLLEVIRPFVARLCTIGVLQKRDFQTLNPCDLLKSRDKFRQAPPLDLPHMKYGEVEGYFGLLITLYHIRKLLSSHGIRPAFEMLEEKLQQGSFARFMSRNEDIWKAKVLMQKSLSHGAPSPKLSKMLEVLIDHFRTKDLQNSRVIIFSNFRGSVRDIMDALANIGEFVKATQFIGQNSGKTLKGQSQKVQQAVLEKFRAGGYNVIVATCIGEEGLDIMEVDLVICFDANVSPLRMIQRMGRTGRKHEGRVVVLACEGTELKGYLRKQANSKSIKKHMHNGGMNSFNFHSSPRMVPHIFKPEVQLQELSIAQFIPRGRKGKDDQSVQIPIFEAKLSDAEAAVIAKYFHPITENTWKLSLIAFPQVQAFPSKVHKVMHSFRTGMLIDTMQLLQGLSFSGDNKSCFAKDEASSDQCLQVQSVDQCHSTMKDIQCFHIKPEVHCPRRVADSDMLPMENSRTQENSSPDIQGQGPYNHSYLFGSDYVSVDALGRVSIASVPILPPADSISKCATEGSSVLPNCSKQNSLHLRSLPIDYKENTLQSNAVSDPNASSSTSCSENENLVTSISQLEETMERTEKILSTPVSKGNLSNGNSTGETVDVAKRKTSMELTDEFSDDFTDTELSPRLTNFIETGVVPESPIDDTGTTEGKGVCKSDIVSTPILKSSMQDQIGHTDLNNSACARNIPASCNDEIQTPLPDVKNSSPRERISPFPVAEEIQTPLANLTHSSCGSDWHVSFGDRLGSVQQEHKFKRLRKYGEFGKRRPPQSKEENIGPAATVSKFDDSTTPFPVRSRDKRKALKGIRAFIEEEVEVSSEVEVSDDEEDELDADSFDGSFIDDRINHTAASTLAEASGNDMMAIYRRSLLSQSPLDRLPSCSVDFSPNTVTTDRFRGAPQTGLESAGTNLTSFQLNPEAFSSGAMPCTTNSAPRGDGSKIESRKRKLSFHQFGSLPAINLEQELLLHSEAAGKESSLQDRAEKIEASGGVFDEDKFYESLDLEEMEKQAAELLRYKSESSTQKRAVVHEPTPQNLSVLGSPSFDLGI